MKKGPTTKPSDSVHANWHLGRNQADILFTEFELVMLRFQQAFERWALHVMARCGDSTMSFAEIVLLHAVRLQGQPCNAQSVARLLNRDDIPNVQYSLRKLVKRGYLMHTHGNAKNYTFAVTELGCRMTDYYAEIRHTVLIAHTSNIDAMEDQIQSVINAVGMLTGQYDEAMRKAATYHFPSLEASKERRQTGGEGRPRSRSRDS
ncbi:MAG: winged helix DNA-binding protein [Burkholderiaceae bacterium]|nr:winged helix DNA-binding protein [Burkholderiaceae bacterium]